MRQGNFICKQRNREERFERDRDKLRHANRMQGWKYNCQLAKYPIAHKQYSAYRSTPTPSASVQYKDRTWVKQVCASLHTEYNFLELASTIPRRGIFARQERVGWLYSHACNALLATRELISHHSGQQDY